VLALAIIAGVVVAILFFLRRRAQRTFHSELKGTLAPPSLLHDFKEYLSLTGLLPEQWEAKGQIIKKLLMVGTPEYYHALDILRALDGQALVKANAVLRISAVCNPAVALNFINQRGILRKRLKNDPNIFAKSEWKLIEDRQVLRQWVFQCYQELCSSYPWNESTELTPVIPVVHGTSEAIADKIIDNGFSALSSLDAGFYGKGMYFSSSARYILPYYATKPNPVILICMAVPGNSYPVVESRTEPNSHLGLPIKPGYQSNYVLTTRDGNPCQFQGDRQDVFDELVLDQEAQVVPCLLVELDRDRLGQLTKEFQRVAPNGAK